MIEALDIAVKGIVQGVGFRPFVYRIAQRYHVCGWVLNAIGGVQIHAEAQTSDLDAFVIALSSEHPAAAQVSEIALHETAVQGFADFCIRFSDDAETEKTTLVSPDLATCDDCVRELFDSNDRRYRYPFINCTNCGPRFTIIDSLPYDRAHTSMAPFKMCNACQSEYDDPMNRRFHAQPNACFDCGPAVGFLQARGFKEAEDEKGAADAQQAAGMRCAEGAQQAESIQQAADAKAPLNVADITWATNRQESDALIAKSVDVLRQGGILAVKGLGGYHLACDATNESALHELRKRKHREGKAFAVMLPSVKEARTWCLVNIAEEQQLTSPARPIVLLTKRPDAVFPAGLADDLPELGVMLPSTPLQHLLLHDFGGMLVMTSGNIHDEPIVTSEEEALSKLAGIADAFLVNNRAIKSRYDDSVVRVLRLFSSAEQQEQRVSLADREAVGEVVDGVIDGADNRATAEMTAENNNAPKEQLAEYDDFFVLQVIRRARGLAPAPLAIPCASSTEAQGADNEGVGNEGTGGDGLGNKSAGSETPEAVQCVFATGPEQKNTFTLTRGAEAFVSQHIGDMENAETFDAWLETKELYERLFQLWPVRIVCDFHPEYLTTKWAIKQAHEQTYDQDKQLAQQTAEQLQQSAGQTQQTSEQPQPTASQTQQSAQPSLLQVQHHHAHVLSVMGENNLVGPVCGIAFDGTGYGADGAIWGGEVLLANLQTYERFANFAYMPLPGGAAAIKNPKRCTYGVLWEADLLNHPAAQPFLASLGSEADLLERMIDRGINTPMTSSVGRLFDAASALLGICEHPRYEGEAAVLLEAALNPSMRFEPLEDAYQISVIKNTATQTSTALDTSVVLLDPAPVFEALLNDMQAGVSCARCAKRFHDAFVLAIGDVANFVRALYGIEVVTLSGGVFMNRYLIERSLIRLNELGFTVAVNRDLPPNDASISYGQAVLALQSEHKG